jgi:hypothetical protein
MSVTCGNGLPPEERETLTQPPVEARSSSGPRSPVAAHPVTSAIIAILVTACIAGTLIVPIYAGTTPKIGDFPFFYVYLLAYMPVVAIVLWIVTGTRSTSASARCPSTWSSRWS